MKKIVLVLSAVLALTLPGFANNVSQSDKKLAAVDSTQLAGRWVLVNRFLDNWEISAKIGTQAYLGEYTLHQPVMKFGEYWTFPALDFGIHKWATHSLGIAIGATFSPYKGVRYRNGDKYATFAKDSDPLYNKDFYLSKGSMGNVYLQGMVNLVNAFGGYKPNRFYNLVMSFGGGIMFPTVPTKYREICSSFNAGLSNKFSLSKHLTLDVDVRGTLHDDMFNGISYYTSDDKPNLSVDATIGATVGLSYRFNWISDKTRNAKGRRVNKEGWTPVEKVVKYTTTYQNLKDEADKSSAAVAASTAALADANDKIAQQEKIIKEHEVITYKEVQERLVFKQYINFVIDTWDISNREKVNILFASEVMKEYPDVKFLISGYADMQTATPDHNKMLSENRAEAVYNVLVKEFGVNPDQLKKADYGGVDYMFFHDEQCSRAVLITALDGKEFKFESFPKEDPNIQYGIQIMSGKTTLDVNSKEFKGYKPQIFNVNSVNKYVVEVSSDLKTVSSQLAEVKAKFPDAFMVRIKGGKLEIYR